MEVNAMPRKMRKPGPSLVIATAALFVALGGTAGAVVDAAVPLAKRALVADNAKKLGGKNEAGLVSEAVDQAAKLPGPASTAAGLVTMKTMATTIGAKAEGEFGISCDSGKKVISGGFSSNGSVFNFDTRPTSDVTWSIYLFNAGTGTANVTLYAVCLA
jgi:hypothetical protein